MKLPLYLHKILLFEHQQALIPDNIKLRKIAQIYLCLILLDIAYRYIEQMGIS
jgi:hypothetical protein